MKPKKVKKVAARRTPAVTILCVLLCLISVLTITLLAVRNITSEEQLKASVERVLEEVDLTEMPASDLIADADSDESVAAYIAREIKRNYVVDVDIEEEDVQKFLEDSTVVDFLAEKLSSTADNIRYDSLRATITKDDVEDLMWDNKKQIEKLVGVELKQADVDSVLDNLEREGVFENLETVNIKEFEPAAYAGVQVLLSNVTLIVMFALILLLCVLIVLCYKWNVCRSCGSVGVTLMVSGGIFLLLCGASYVLTMAWSSMISYLIRMAVNSSLISAVIFFVVGAIMVAVDRITRKPEQIS